MAYLPVSLSGTCWGFDTSAKLSASAVAALADADMSTVSGAPAGTHPHVFVRYVGLDRPNSLFDIDSHELQLIRVVNAVLLLVQHCEQGSWIANAQKGRARGEWAVKNALSAGYAPVAGYRPPGLILDLESVKNPGPDCLAYVNEWAGVVGGAGFRPIIYVGFDCGLSLEQLTALCLPLWASPGRTPPPARGFAGQQGLQKSLAGVDIDPDRFMPDLTGEVIVGMGEVDLNTIESYPHTDPSGLHEDPTEPPPAARRLAIPWRMRRLPSLRHDGPSVRAPRGPHVL